jgi:acetylornithine deacetylase/succinyl-diaminopimelate desuccinylase-like protein
MSLDPVELLQKLIQAPSVNPMGRDISGPTYGESRVTALLADICNGQGWPYSQQRVHEGRFNLLALIEGFPAPQNDGELIVWDVHQDTVPVEGMTVDPFGGEVRDGRVYGRGACDVKGSMAAMLAALSRVNEPPRGQSLKGREIARRPTIVLACTVNEECGFTGSNLLVRGWTNPSMPLPSDPDEAMLMAADAFAARICRQRPDAAIVAEPTECDVVVAHQGAVRWRCHTVGRAAHTSRPDEGVNAIYAMASIVHAIERFHALLGRTAAEHPLCGRPSVCVSTIHGGVGINTVPERATIEIDRRLGPEEQPDVAHNDLIQFIAAQADTGNCRVEHDPPFMASGGLSDKHNRPIAERLSKLVQQTGRRSELVGVPFGTDAAALSAAGVPTVVFGPGSIAQAHTADEYIEIDELQFATDIFHRIARGGLISTEAET